MSYTHRVVVVREGKPGFSGASGVYDTLEDAQGALLDVARTWEGLAEPEWFHCESGHGVVGSAFTVRPSDMPVQTYSILTERKAV